MTTGPQPTWTFPLALGVIGGGPTFLGGVIGYTFVSPLLSIVFLGVAAGALIYVFNEMMATSRKFAQPVASMWPSDRPPGRVRDGLLPGRGRRLRLARAPRAVRGAS